MTNDVTTPSVQDIQTKIHILPIRPPFMLAADLAEFYETETKRIVEAVKRNLDRFPEDFAFTLSEVETAQLKTQNAASNMANRALPLAFTEAGALALSGVLKTKRAAEVSVWVYRGFVALRHEVAQEAELLTQRLLTAQNELLASMPGWAQIKLMRDLGSYSNPQIIKRIKMSGRRFYQELQLMENCGLLAMGAWDDGSARAMTERIRDVELRLSVAERAIGAAQPDLFPEQNHG